MLKPIVSIIIPVYNAADFLADTLQSCVEQDERRIEILVVDDGSTDRSCEVVEDWVKRDARIRLHRSVNMGQNVSRNIGLSLAEGRYVKFLDHDDMLVPWSVSQQLALIEQSEVQGVIGGLERHGTEAIRKAWEDCAGKKPELDQASTRVYENVMRANIEIMATPNEWMLERDLIRQAGGFSRYVITCEEVNLWYRLYRLKPSLRVLYAPKPVVLLKRVFDEALSLQAKREEDLDWPLISLGECARMAIRDGVQNEATIKEEIFDSVYTSSRRVFRHGKIGLGLAGYRLWKRAGVSRPKLEPAYHDWLHGCFGFFFAEYFLLKLRALAGLFRSDQS